tara:strand:+ start:1278 stop:3524 length:2247 start_codon:yes stop_codon:yes gene_type:complete
MIFKLKILIKILLFSLILSQEVLAEKIKKITIIGNERISKETIIMFSDLKLNKETSTNDLNNSIKKLYETGYFEKINIEIKSNEIIVKVKENLIIQSIEIRGVKNKTILKEIEKITKPTEKTSYVVEKIQSTKTNILNLLKNAGFYFAEVDPKIVKNNNNSVDIFYDIKMYERSIISKINFIGNTTIKDKKLRDVIVSEEGKFWKFLTRNKYLDVNRIDLDKRLLANFYKNKGYYNVSIESSYASLANNNNFELNFKINSGLKHYFNEINFNIPDEFTSENFKKFDNIFEDLEGKKYSLNSIEKIIKEINKIALVEEFQFINVKYDEKIVDKNKINLSFSFGQTEKLYIERINVFGNYITEERVIRNSLIVDEGDPFNVILFDKSIQNLKSRNIFKSIKKEVIDSENDYKKKIINLTVDEKPTGEIFAGLGAGTGGSSISAGIKENNYLGKGIGLNANLGISDTKIKGIFAVENPNFKNSDRSLNTVIESSTSDYMSTSGYKSSKTGFSLGTSFEQLDDLFVSPKISTYYETIDTSSKASAAKRKQEGDYIETLFTYGLTVNKLDQNFQPSDGYKTTFRQTVPIYSEDDFTFNHYLNAEKYFSYADDLIFSAKFYAEAVNSVNDDVRISKRVFLPAKRLRGFSPGKVGPQDGGEYIGGNYGSALNLTSDLPMFSQNQSVDFNIFLDVANLWGVDYSKLLDDSKIRSSTGIGLDWFTPVGPLTFSLAIPITKEHTDETETLRFNIGTSF